MGISLGLGWGSTWTSDGDQHGPMADKLVSFLTDNDSIKIKEAKEAAEYSVKARIELWDSVLSAIPKA